MSDPLKTKRPPNVALRRWLKISTGGQRAAVCTIAKTTVGNLYQIAGGHTGMSIDMARAIHGAIKEITPDYPMEFNELLLNGDK